MKKVLKGCGIVFAVVVIGVIVLAVIGSLLPDSDKAGNETEIITEPTNEIIESASEAEAEDVTQNEIIESALEAVEEVTQNEIEDTPSTDQSKPTQTSEPIVEDNAPTFEEFCLSSTTGGSTELQWDTFKEQTVGNNFVDRVGIVRNVDEDLLGNYNLWIDIGDSYNSCSLEIYFEVAEGDSINIQKDQFIIFGGEISSISEMFSTVTIHLDSAYFNNDPDAIAEVAKEIEPSLGKINEPAECGEYFTVTVLEEPEIVQSMGYGNTAVGKYYVVKVEIMNNTSQTVSGFDEDYFGLQANLDGKLLEFAADWDPSYYAAKRNYGYAIISDDVPPSLPWKTQVVFDVNPDATNFVFSFSPRDNYFDSNAMCSVQISLDETE